jgi:hypothetical protein
MILNRVPVEKGAHLQSLHKAPVDESPTKFPIGAPMESDVPPLSSRPHVLPDPQKERSPLTDTSFPEPSNYLLKFQVNGLHRFPNGPLWRETSVSRTFFYAFPSKSPVNEPLSMFPNRFLMEREVSSPEPALYLFIHLRIPVRVYGALQQKTEKIFGHRPRSPTWAEGLHTMGCGLVPQGDRLRHGAPRGRKAYIQWGAA